MNSAPPEKENVIEVDAEEESGPVNVDDIVCEFSKLRVEEKYNIVGDGDGHDEDDADEGISEYDNVDEDGDAVFADEETSMAEPSSEFLLEHSPSDYIYNTEPSLKMGFPLYGFLNETSTTGERKEQRAHLSVEKFGIDPDKERVKFIVQNKETGAVSIHPINFVQPSIPCLLYT